MDDDVPLEKLLAPVHRDLIAKGCSEVAATMPATGWLPI